MTGLQYGFIGASAVTLFAPNLRVWRREPVCSVQPSHSFRISSSVVQMATNSISEPGKKSSSRKPRKTKSINKNSEEDEAKQSSSSFGTDDTEEYTEVNEKETFLDDPEDSEFMVWASSAENEEARTDDVPLDDLFEIEGGASRPSPLDDEIIMDGEFDEEDGDGDGDGDDADPDDEDEYDEDEELTAQANEGLDEDAALQSVSTQAGRKNMRPSKYALIDEPVEDDEIEDDNEDVGEILQPIGNDLDTIFEEEIEDDQSVGASKASGLSKEDKSDDLEDVEYGDESEEELQSAANILSDKGLLGLGVSGGGRTDMADVKSFALGDDNEEAALSALDESKAEVAPIETDKDNDFDDIGDDEEEEEDGEDDEFTLTTKSSSGSIWDLNEDTYVTITEPGESYAYELDEEDEEDQEMATMRRGKQGGWSGGLASYPASDLLVGSKEWIARRSYELLSKATPSEMFQWTRRHRNPPSLIADLYPDDPPAPEPLRKTKLQMSSPDADPTYALDSSNVDRNDSIKHSGISHIESNESETESALERAVDFPCQYRFKIEGSGEGFLQSLKNTVIRVLGTPVSDESFHMEWEGRYMRVVIMVHVENAKQVTELYDALRSNPGVKYSYG